MSHKTKILIADCSTCHYCKLPILTPGQQVPINWKHFCTKKGQFAITKKMGDQFVVGIKNASTCKHYELKNEE
jgi:hypothetical protein